MNKETLFEFVRYLQKYYENKEEIDKNNSDYDIFINYFSTRFTCKEFMLFNEFMNLINKNYYSIDVFKES